MNEQIIQITATSGGEDNLNDVLYALTSEGRLFRLNGAQDLKVNGKMWAELPEPPQLRKQ